MRSRKALSLLLAVALVFSTFNTNVKAATTEALKYEIAVAVDTTNLNLASFETDLKNQMITEMQSSRGVTITAGAINISYVQSSSVKTSDQSAWTIYDHYYSPTYYASAKTQSDADALLALAGRAGQPFYYYRESSGIHGTFYTTETAGNANVQDRDKHIYANGSRITFLGYSAPAYNDMLVYPDSNSGKKTIDYSIYLSNVSTHTLQGAGFLVNASISGSGVNAVLNGYLVYYDYVGGFDVSSFTGDTLSLYKLTNVNLDAYHQGTVDIGSAGFQLVTTGAIQVSGKSVKDIRIEASSTSIKFYEKDGTDVSGQYLTALDYTIASPIPNSYGFGPVVSYNSHGCTILTTYTYDNLSLQSSATKSFSDKVLDPKWHDGAVHALINIDDSGIVNFADANARTEMLQRLLERNVHYIGWGSNDKTNENSFVSQNNSNGLTIKTDGTVYYKNNTTGTANGYNAQITEIAKYLVSLVDPNLNDVPVANIAYDGTTLSSTSTDPNGDTLIEHWSVKEAGEASWTTTTDAAVATTELQNRIAAGSGKNVLVQLIVEDTDGTLSEPDVIYLSTEVTAKPVANFVIAESIDLETDATTVTPNNLSYDPVVSRSNQTYAWEIVNEMGKTVSTTTGFEPTLDFGGLSAGRYDVKLTASTQDNSIHSNIFIQSIIITDSIAPKLVVGLTGTRNSATATIQITDNGSGPDSYRIITTDSGNVQITGPWVPAQAARTITKTYAFTPSTLNALSIEVKDGSGNTESYPIDFSIPMIAYTPNGGQSYSNFEYTSGGSTTVRVDISSLSAATITRWFYQWTNSATYPGNADITTEGTSVSGISFANITKPTTAGSHYLHVYAVNSNNTTQVSVSEPYIVSELQEGAGVNDFHITGFDGSGIHFSWTAPTNATAQKIQYSTDNGVTWLAATHAGLNGSSSTALVTGLVSTDSYKFRLLVDAGEKVGPSNVALWEDLITYAANESAVNVTKNVTLSTELGENVTVTWTSNDASVIDTKGNVFRPLYPSTNQNITLTATIHDGATTSTIPYSLTVLATTASDEEKVALDKNNVQIIYGGGDSASQVTQNVTLPASATPSNGSTVTWASNNAAIAVNAQTGTVTRPAYGEGDLVVLLTATITQGVVTETKVFSVLVKQTAATDAEAIAELAIGYAAFDDASHVTKNLILPGQASNGTAATWSSDTLGSIDNSGTVVRPANGLGNASVALTATVGASTRVFNLTVLEQQATTAASLAADKALLNILYAVGDTVTSVTQNVTFVTLLPNGTSVTWSTDNAAIGVAGAVTRPANGVGNVNVNVTADLVLDGLTDQAIFTPTVLELPVDQNSLDTTYDVSQLAIVYAGSDYANSVTLNVGLPTSGTSGSAISWATSSSSRVDTVGNVFRPNYVNGDQAVTLTATLVKGNATTTVAFEVIVKALDTTDVNWSIYDKALLDITYAQGDSVANVTKDVTLPSTSNKGKTVTWVSSDPTLVTTAGVINAASIDKIVRLTATIDYNDFQETKFFDILVKARAAAVAPVYVAPVEAPKPATVGTIVYVNGISQVAGDEQEKTKDGKKDVTITLNNEVISQKMDDMIAKAPDNKNNVLEIPVIATNVDQLKVSLTGDIIKKMESSNFDISVKSDNIDYIIPAEEIRIDRVAEMLNVSTESLKSIEIDIQMTKSSAGLANQIQLDAEKNNYQVMFAPVEFTVNATTTNTQGVSQTVTINKFSQYVTRVLQIPEGIDPTKITTGIVYNADGTFSHVPTTVYQVNGVWFASLNSLTNSTYSIIWNPITVASVENHWSKLAVNDMASRLVISNPETFDPNAKITRGEFAEYVVKALGLYRTNVAIDSKYTDVTKLDAYADAITTATEYGLIHGYLDNTFRATGTITREEAMAIVARALDVIQFTNQDTSKVKTYVDYAQVSGWAKEDVAKVVSAHVFNGSVSGLLTSKSELTFAQAAQAVENLLKQAELINK